MNMQNSVIQYWQFPSLALVSMLSGLLQRWGIYHTPALTIFLEMHLAATHSITPDITALSRGSLFTRLVEHRFSILISHSLFPVHSSPALTYFSPISLSLFLSGKSLLWMKCTNLSRWLHAEPQNGRWLCLLYSPALGHDFDFLLIVEDKCLRTDEDLMDCNPLVKQHCCKSFSRGKPVPIRLV